MLVHFWSLSVTQGYALGTLPSLVLTDRERTGLAYIDVVSVEWKRVLPGKLCLIIIIFILFFFSGSGPIGEPLHGLVCSPRAVG